MKKMDSYDRTMWLYAVVGVLFIIMGCGAIAIENNDIENAIKNATTISTTTTSTETTSTETTIAFTSEGKDQEFLRRDIVKAIRENPGAVVTLDGKVLYEYSGTVYEVKNGEKSSLRGLFYTNSLEDYWGEQGTEVYLADGNRATAVLKTVGDPEKTHLHIMQDGETIKQVQVEKETQVIGSYEGRIVVWTQASKIEVWDINNSSWTSLYEAKDRVIDATAKYGRLWVLTESGKVWTAAWKNGGELKLVSENGVALSPNMSDAPGWFEPGEINPEWNWVFPEIHAKFVSAWDVIEG